MSVDKLVDSTQLDADLTTVANAIRTKGGTAAQLSFPSGMAQAIADLPSGGSEPWTSSSLAYKWSFSIFPDNYVLDYDCSYLTGYVEGANFKQVQLVRAFYDARQMKEITLRNLYKIPPSERESLHVTFESFATKDGGYGSFTDRLEKISIPNYTVYPSTSFEAFSKRANLKVIDILFNMSQLANYSQGYNWRNMFNGCSALEEIRFVPNSILWMNTSYQLFNVSQVLSDASLVSIANALAPNSATPNLKLLSTPYARCSALMGTVTDGFFTADESGTVTLADFITNTKGWTLYT